jgi:hypothetical protein
MCALSHSYQIGSVLQSGFQQLEDFPLPFWLALFVEGTRFTQEKLLAAQNYAASRGLYSPKNVLIPRTKVNFGENFAKIRCYLIIAQQVIATPISTQTLLYILFFLFFLVIWSIYF